MAALVERRRLLQTVHDRWIVGALRQSPLQFLALWDTLPAECRPLCDLVVQRPGARPASLAAHTAITRLWDECQQRLLILGSPGSGKTTLLLELAGRLLSDAQQDSARALPVVFDLAEWSGPGPTLNDWLTDELHVGYDVPRQQARRWLDEGAILPLFDGFDETTPAAREDCLQAVEVWQSQRGLWPLAFCSQPADYETLTARLRLPGAVLIQPLHRQQISQCLMQIGESPAAVRTALQQDPVLWEILRTPLLLGVAILNGRTQETSVARLTGSAAERQALLWERYVQDRVHDTVAGDSSASPSMLAHLSRLAAFMQRRRRTWLRPADAPPWTLSRRAWARLLEQAAQRGLLLRMGDGYRFAHRLLQDYLASLAAHDAPAEGEAEPSELTARSYPARAYRRDEPGHGAGPSDSGRSAPLLQVDELTVSFGACRVVEGLSFTLRRGETLGVVGESGSGKSLTALALLRLAPAGATLTGRIRFAGHHILALPERELEHLRGRRMAMIFQEPMTALNPVLSVGEQIAEMFVLHDRVSGREARRRAVAALGRVHIADPARRAGDYPHQLSGGMRQRVMIAMALACRPDLLIADEPTTALDVTVQAHILDLILELQEDLGMAMLFISHNLGVVSQVADRVLVMYAGKALEVAPTERLLKHPEHPYTRALLATLPRLGGRRRRLPTIPGTVPRPRDATPACVFAARCPLADERCRRITPTLRDQGGEHWVACLKAGA
jgi:oligopeptide/dipeptide ABC transporter ATP-binding protein